MRVTMIVCLLFAVLMSGCGYTLQGRSDLPFEAISMGTVLNSTVEPKLQDRMNRLLTETLMEYGFDVRSSARYRIEGKISRFDLTPV